MKTQGHTRGPTAGPGAAASGEEPCVATTPDDNERAVAT